MVEEKATEREFFDRVTGGSFDGMTPVNSINPTDTDLIDSCIGVVGRVSGHGMKDVDAVVMMGPVPETGNGGSLGYRPVQIFDANSRMPLGNLRGQTYLGFNREAMPSVGAPIETGGKMLLVSSETGRDGNATHGLNQIVVSGITEIRIGTLS